MPSWQGNRGIRDQVNASAVRCPPEPGEGRRMTGDRLAETPFIRPIVPPSQEAPPASPDTSGGGQRHPRPERVNDPNDVLAQNEGTARTSGEPSRTSVREIEGRDPCRHDLDARLAGRRLGEIGLHYLQHPGSLCRATTTRRILCGSHRRLLSTPRHARARSPASSARRGTARLRPSPRPRYP